MTGRIERSIQVAKQSYAVLRSNPALTLFPILSAIAGLVVSIPFIAPMILTAMGSKLHQPTIDALHYVLLAGLYFCNYFVVIFFNAALVASANEELSGRKATVAFGVEFAIKRLPQILGWTLVASTVGMVLKMISERLGFIGSIITGLIGMAWNFAVFFVVPTLVIESVGPVQAVKTSTEMIKKSWGERIILGAGIGTAFGLALLLSIIPFGIGIALLIANSFLLGGIFLVLGLVYIAAASIVFSSLTTIFQTALYIYCRTGVVPAGFQTDTMQGAFQEKPVRTAFGRRF